MQDLHISISIFHFIEIVQFESKQAKHVCGFYFCSILMPKTLCEFAEL